MRTDRDMKWKRCTPGQDLDTGLDCLVDPFADGFKLEIDLVVGETKDFQTIPGKNAAACLVVLKSLFRAMLMPVQFDDQLRTGAVKICDKRFNNALLVDLYRIAAQKLIPELFSCGVISRRSSRARDSISPFLGTMFGFMKSTHFRFKKKLPLSGELASSVCEMTERVHISSSKTAWERADGRRG